MNIKPPSFLFRRITRAFSLVEVTLALGIVTFALVGVVGVLPVAMNGSRQSFDKNRAAAIAETLFTSFRSQPFDRVCYYDDQFDSKGVPKSDAANALNLNTTTTSSVATLYATFLDVSTSTDDAFGSQRHLCFTTTSFGGGAAYLVTMHFNTQPAGMAVLPATAPVQANLIELTISPVGRPRDQYRFVSLVANRTN